MHQNSRKLLLTALLLLLFGLAIWLGTVPFFASVSPLEHDPVLLGEPQEAWDALEAVRRGRSALEQGESNAIGLRALRYWWVAAVNNPLESGNWMLHVGNTAIERAELFVFDDEELLHHAAVDLLAEAKEAISKDVIGHHFAVDLPTGVTRTLALRLETGVAHRGLIFIKPAGVAAAEAHFHRVAIWISAGAILALIGYNLFLGVGLRMPAYFYYAGHASGHLLYLLTALGIVGSTLPIVERYLVWNIPGIGLGVLFGALFIYTFLNLPRLAPRLALLFRLFIGALLFSPLLALLLEPHQLLTLIRGSHLLLVVLVLAAALTGVARNLPEARYILIGWGGLIAITAPGMLGVMGVLELTIDTGIRALWAVVFEMFFLSLALADRVRRLHGEREAATAAYTAKSAFLANMSHEIRTPLNGVLGMVEVLGKTKLDQQQREYLNHIGQSGTILLSTLNDILDYSRVEAGRIILEQHAFDLRQLLEQLRFLSAAQAAKKGLELELDIDPRVPSALLGDVGRLRQVLLNLLGNAIKFTEKGSVRLKLELLSQDDDGNHLRFSVTDTGIGIDEEAQRHLFDRFHQADGTIARRYGGSGLGLAIVQELVALMNGNIRLHSQPDQGSRVVVELTLPSGTEHPEEKSNAEAITLPPLNILAVDDDHINRLVASQLLAAEGHRVVAVESGAAALERIHQESFDLVLMDLSMPEMDGLEVTRRLRALHVTIPIIGLTAHVLPEHKLACLQAGMDDVTHKPLRPGQLQGIISGTLFGDGEGQAVDEVRQASRQSN